MTSQSSHQASDTESESFEEAYHYSGRWGDVYRNLDFLNSIADLSSATPSQAFLGALERQVRHGADINGPEGYFEVDGELDEMYDGVGRLMEQTPLMWAVLNENVDVAARLLELGADPDLPNSSGILPLELAINTHNSDLVDLLIVSGATLPEPIDTIRLLEEQVEEEHPSSEVLTRIINSLYGMVLLHPDL